jgi:hypothetical protein
MDMGADAGVVGMLGYEVGDSIHGHRIIAEARKVSDPVVIVKSARHKAQSGVNPSEWTMS